MHFAYEGFRQTGDLRCFLFRCIEGLDPVSLFCLEVDMPLFLLHRVPVQEGPSFCLRLLEAALRNQPSAIESFRKYKVKLEDFQALVRERKQKLSSKTYKAPRRPFKKPSVGSNLFLGMPARRPS
jgi:hypothetical protein